MRAQALALGYRPNALVSALMTYRRSARKEPRHTTIAYVTRYPARSGGNFYARYFKALFTGAVERAQQQGYKLEEFSLTQPGLTVRRFCGILRARNIPGLLIAPLPESHAHLRLEWGHFSSVALGTSLVEPLLHRSANDYFHSVILAMQRCAALGFHRPGLALRIRVNDRVEQRWLAAYQVAQRVLPSADRLPALRERPWTFRGFKAWFQEHRPDVILGTQTNEIDGWLHRLGRRVPREVEVVSLDFQPEEDGRLGLTQNYPLIAATGVDFLIGMLQRGERGIPERPITLLSEGQWVDETSRSGRMPLQYAPARQGG